jgi:spore maturation protein CgeB
MKGLDFVFLGLSITSSWGNGHATTYRALVRELTRRGHRVLFLERDVAWYADNRDMTDPPWGETELYATFDELVDRFRTRVRGADVVIVGSYVPEGVRIGHWVNAVARGTSAFYDIDTPVTMKEVEQGRCQYLTRELISRYDLYLSFTGGPTLERLESHFGARSARPLYCSVDPEVHFCEPHEPTWDLGYIGTFSADRQPGLESLLVQPARAWPNGRFVVAGPQYPAEIRWPENVRRLEHVAPSNHRTFYNSQRFALNLTRADMARAGWSPSVRLFEAAACATPMVSDAWPGLATFFEPGREILIAQTTRDALSILRDTPENKRLAVGRRARARVLSEHTAARRAETLERWVREVRDANAARRPRRLPRSAWEAT